MFATLKHTQEGMNDDDNVVVMQLNNRNWNSIEYFMCTSDKGWKIKVFKILEGLKLRNSKDFFY